MPKELSQESFERTVALAKRSTALTELITEFAAEHEIAPWELLGLGSDVQFSLTYNLNQLKPD